VDKRLGFKGEYNINHLKVVAKQFSLIQFSLIQFRLNI